MSDERADFQRQQDDERRRTEEFYAAVYAKGAAMRCPSHPDRPVVDWTVCTLQRCAECLHDSQMRWLDDQIKRGGRARFNDPAQWPASYDMAGYTDAERASTGMVNKERK